MAAPTSPNSKLRLQQKPEGVLVWVKVQAGAKKNRLAGLWQAKLKIAVQAPAQQGKANQAVIALLAKSFGLAKNRVHILQGEASKEKMILLRGATCDDIEKWAQQIFTQI